MRNICFLLASVFLLVLILPACQATESPVDDIPTGEASDTSSVVSVALTEAPAPSYEEGLYEACDYVLSTEKTTYPVDVSYIDVTVTGVKTGCEVNYGGSYNIFRVEDGEETFLCYGGGDVGCILTPKDENSFAEGTLRMYLDPIREYQGIEFVPGTYRVHIDNKTIDIVLEAP